MQMSTEATVVSLEDGGAEGEDSLNALKLEAAAAQAVHPDHAPVDFSNQKVRDGRRG